MDRERESERERVRCYSRMNNDREQLHQRWRELDEEVMYPGLNGFFK